MTNKKIGVFGGSFNPIHQGHINSMLTVADLMNLTTIKVVPALQTPLKLPTEGPSPEQRLEMVKLGVKEYPEILEVDEVELKRDGTSYTIDTLEQFQSLHKDEEIYLIIGADQFEKFDKWKGFKEILSKVHLIVTTRPGAQLPKSKEEFPEGVKDLVEIFDYDQATLSTGNSISFIKLKDVNVSATDIRKRLRTGRSVAQFLPFEVEKYIRDNGLFNTIGDKVKDYKEFTMFCADFLKNKSAIQVEAFDLTGLDQPSEFTIAASGTSGRNTSSLAENLIRAVKDEYGVFPYTVDGEQEGRWVVLDYGNLIVHLFYDFVRMEYKLEDLWSEGTRLL